LGFLRRRYALASRNAPFILEISTQKSQRGYLEALLILNNVANCTVARAILEIFKLQFKLPSNFNLKNYRKY
jgi:hypothetical protein